MILYSFARKRGAFFIAAYWIFLLESLQATLATLLTGALVFDDNESLGFGNSQAKEALFRHYKDKITTKIDEVVTSFANSTDQQNARKIGGFFGSICTNLLLAKGTAIITEEVIGTIAKVAENFTYILKGETEFVATLVDLEPSVKKTLTPFTTGLEEASEIAETAHLRPNPGYKPKAPKGIIKQFDDSVVNRYRGHIFSDDHKRKGILKLGQSEDDILNSFKSVVASIDAEGLLKEGTSQIQTCIKGFDVELKVHVVDGAVRSFNGYIGHSSRVFPNCIKWFKEV